MSHTTQINYRTYLRSIIAVLMMVVWSLVMLSVFLLWLVPHGPRSGQTPLLFDLTKREWGELHLWLSLVAIAVTVAHLIVDWRGLCGCMKYLASVHRHSDSTAAAISAASQSKPTAKGLPWQIEITEL